MLAEGLAIAGVRFLVGLLARALPFAVYGVLAGHVPPKAKVVVGVLIVGLTAGVARVHPQVRAWAEGLASSAAFLLAACAMVHPMRRAVQAGTLTRPALAVFCTALFLVTPALIVHGEATLLVVVLGFEITFSSFSYCVEQVEHEPTMADCMRFLLINPMLVYRPLAPVERPLPLRLRAVARVLLGVAVLYGYHVLVLALPFVGLSYDGEQQTPFEDLPGYGRFASMMGANVLVFYMAHSGLASLQIGCMRLLGHDVPERYHLPFLAQSPADFWRRWNTYLGAWLKRYVFNPMAAASRRQRRGPVMAAWGAPVFVTFVLCGAMHDLTVYLRSFDFTGGGLMVFSLAAISILVWTAAERALQRARWPRAAVVALGTAFILHVHLVLAFIALPTLAGAPLPRPLRHLISG